MTTSSLKWLVQAIWVVAIAYIILCIAYLPAMAILNFVFITLRGG